MESLAVDRQPQIGICIELDNALEGDHISAGCNTSLVRVPHVKSRASAGERVRTFGEARIVDRLVHRVTPTSNTEGEFLKYSQGKVLALFLEEEVHAGLSAIH